MGIHASQPPAPEFSGADLSYALEVSQLAYKLQMQDFRQELGDPQSCSRSERDAWSAKNPISEYIKRVHASSVDAARLIRKLQAAESPAG